MYKILIFIILISFALSFAYSFYFQIRPAVDAAAYDKIAWNLVSGNGYKENASLSYDEDIAILRVGPGYQFFLAGIYFIFGRHYQIAWVINALLHALTALFTYLLSREVLKEEWNKFLGIASALFIGLSPDLITMSGMLMTETPAVFLVVLSVYLFFLYINNASQSVYLLIILALVFGFAVLVRTPAALMSLPIFYYFLEKKQFKHSAVFIAVLAIIFVPWTVRNYKVYDTFIPTNYVFGYDLLIGNHPAATGELEPYEPAERYIREYGPIKGNELALKDALIFISKHPLEFIKTTLRRISIYFSFARPTGFWFHLEGIDRLLTLILSALYSVLIFGFGFWGIYRTKALSPLLRERTGRLFYIFIMMPLAVSFIIVETRYRFLSYPILAVFAGFGLANFFKQRSGLQTLFAILGTLFLNSAIDGLRNFDRIAERIKEFL